MKIGIGISGGVDSAQAASMLLAEGHQVVGITMRLTPKDDPARAIAVAEKLGIPHRVVDFQEIFQREILDYFVKEYSLGRTPSPCCRCNPLIKFGKLWEALASEGCERMATGHYARVDREKPLGCRLLRAVDRGKDQSYFLAQLSQEQLSRVLFPLGNQWKREVKEVSHQAGLVSKQQSESQDLCFLPDQNFADFVGERMPELQKKGKILDLKGNCLGTHCGAFRYTLGQRKGLGLGGGPWFVVETNVQENIVRIAHLEEMTGRDTISLSGMNWLMPMPPAGEPISVEVQLRYRMRAVPATLVNEANGNGTLLFEAGAPLVPAGQLAVAYCGDEVVASGWIES